MVKTTTLVERLISKYNWMLQGKTNPAFTDEQNILRAELEKLKSCIDINSTSM